MPLETIKPITTTGTTVAAAPPLRPLPLRDLLGYLEADAETRYKAKQAGQPLGPQTGLRHLDTALGGALAPGLHILHGSPGVGKTAFALQSAACCGFPALYVTAEMSPLELLRRHTACVTNTPLRHFKSGELAPGEVMKRARHAAAEAPLLTLLDVTEQPATPDQIRDAAEATRARDESAHLLIVVDSLHSWADGQEGAAVPEYDRLNEALASLRVLSKQLVCPILAISERNRASMKGGQSAGAGTRKIEYGAETVIELDVEDKAEPDEQGETAVQLRISKNRNGAAGKPIHLFFHGAMQRYREDSWQE